FVIADDKRIPNDIFIPKGKMNGAVSGHKVIAKITKYPEHRMSAEGEITKILGHKNDPGIDILSIIYKHGIKMDFPQEVLDQASSTPEELSKEDMEGRRDLRDETIVTIDGADAKDLDDAVSVKKLSNGIYQLGVYIADVSYYVEANSPIDQEAFERGTSVRSDQASSTPEELSKEDMEGRRDLRDETIVTIDGADAKDLDDAVSVKKLSNGIYQLGVYIADVSYYVEANSPIDQEAFERGTSV